MCRQNIPPSGLIHLAKKKDLEIEFEDSDDEDECSEEEEKNGKDEIVDKKRVIIKKEISQKTKSETVISIINNYPEGRFIVFSSHDSSFELVKPLCLENNIEVLELKGGRASKEKKLQKYQTGEVNVILLNSKFNGADLNLQMTTHIILYHEMNEYIEKQVIGRANRIGRVDELIIHRLV